MFEEGVVNGTIRPRARLAHLSFACSPPPKQNARRFPDGRFVRFAADVVRQSAFD